MTKQRLVVNEGKTTTVKAMKIAKPIAGLSSKSGGPTMVDENCPIASFPMAELGSIFIVPPNLERIKVDF